MLTVCAFQGPFPRSFSGNEEAVDRYVRWLGECSDEVDLILLPEGANCPFRGSLEQLEAPSTQQDTERLMDAIYAAARRCNAWVAVNLLRTHECGKRNSTVLVNQRGETVTSYDKQHLTLNEITKLKLDDSYLWQNRFPVYFDIGGLRVGFLTCYDIYFPEYIAHLAKYDLNLVLFPSYERGEHREVLEVQCRYCALTTNAFVLRSSVSMGEQSETGGSTMLVSPDGMVLANLGQQNGMLKYTIDDPGYKRMLNNGYGNPPVPADRFPEVRRKPWAYRPAGSAVVPNDASTPYPRICAHRGFNTILPENSLPALAAAVALGTDEIELDVRTTSDGEFVVCHDADLIRVAGSEMTIHETSWAEIAQLDIGVEQSPHLKGLRLVTVEQVLRRFARQTIFNVHIKQLGNTEEPDPTLLQKLVDLITRYDCHEHVYLAGRDNLLALASEIAPDMSRCCLDGDRAYTIVDRAIRYGCQRVQFFKAYFTSEMVERAHENGIRCNVFWADDPDEAAQFLDMGIDTILTNDFLAVLPAIVRAKTLSGPQRRSVAARR